MKQLGWLRFVLFGAIVFLYTPIAVLAVMSFNSSELPFVWKGLSAEWYLSLSSNELVLEGLKNTLLVAVTTTLVATTLGTLLAIGITRYNKSAWLESLALSPAIIPDLALAIGLLAMFTTFAVQLNLFTVMLSHIVFSLAIVAAVVRGRLAEVDNSLEEAALDLGDSGIGAFWRVTVPSLRPAIISGALLVFTLSLDEFVIAFFTDGPSTPTLPIVIYSMVRFGVTPEINALATIIMATSFIMIFVAQRKSKVLESL